MSAKEQVAALLQRLPEDVELAEIAREVEVLAAIRIGENQADRGQVVAHDEGKQRFYSWFTRTVWAEQALIDLREISEFISRRDPQAALRLGEAIFARVEKLPAFPFMSRTVPKLGRNNLREIIHGSHRIFSRVVEVMGLIEVLRVWHAARGEPDLAI